MTTTNPDCPQRSHCLEKLWPNAAAKDAPPLDCGGCPNIHKVLPLSDIELVGAARLLMAVFEPELWSHVVKTGNVDQQIVNWVKTVVCGSRPHSVQIPEPVTEELVLDELGMYEGDRERVNFGGS